MLGIDLEMASHRLDVDLNMKPVKQMKRAFNVELYQTMGEEIEKLLKAGFIEEVN